MSSRPTPDATHATETFTARDAVELALVERSGFVESRHLGSAVVLDPDGVPVRTLGDVTTPVFARSSLKPVQAATCLALGADLHDEAAGLATASHAGTPAHVAVVARMLAEGDLTPSDLRCPQAWPGDSAARQEWAAAGHGPDRLHMNCSGKHAAMLRACRAQGWSTHDYTDPGHPLQREIAATLERAGGEPIAATGVDGCGAPLFAVSLTALARATAWATAPDAADPAQAAAARVVEAVHRFPWTIDGEGRENTLVIQHLGALAKGGAEGVLVVAAPGGCVALKVLDGAARPATLVALTLLTQAGALDADAVAAFLPRLPLDVRGGDEVVGRIRAVV